MAHPRVTVEFPPGYSYRTNTWVVDPPDGWTIQQLLDDLSFTVGFGSGYKLQKEGVDCDPSALAHEVFGEGDTATVVSE